MSISPSPPLIGSPRKTGRPLPASHQRQRGPACRGSGGFRGVSYRARRDHIRPSNQSPAPLWSSLAGLPAISHIVLALSPGARDGPSIACRANTNSALAERARSTSRWARDRPVSPDPETLRGRRVDFAIASLPKRPFSLETTFCTRVRATTVMLTQTNPSFAAQARPRLDPRPVRSRP